MTTTLALPHAFGHVVAEGIDEILKHQQADGSINFNPAAPVVYPQQSIFPLAFVYTGRDPEQRWLKHGAVRTAIEKLGKYLCERFNEQGEFAWDSHGYKVQGVDQRLTNAWTEALKLLRDAGADFDYGAWSKKILAACDTLIEHRLKRLAGVRRFLGRVMGTSTNHVSLYCSTVYRAGTVLNRPDLVEFILPIARALAADVHPDGYWDEHNDLLRAAGPTPSYNYLTHCGMALMAEWTGEAVFKAAVERSTRFHGNFCYPDASFCDVIDERVRYDSNPRIWGLFGFSHSPEGRGTALAHMRGWLRHFQSNDTKSPEALARMCENHMYWHAGDAAEAPFERHSHRAMLTLPGGIFRSGPWCVGLSAIKALNPEDPVYRENPFGLDRQKLFSVWHEKTGLLLDGSHSKNQPEGGTFRAESTNKNSASPKAQTADYYPMGGAVGEDDGGWVVNAAYKTFFGTVRLRVLSDSALQVDLSADHAGCNVPVAAGFTLKPRGTLVSGKSGKTLLLEAEALTATGKELGGGFQAGLASIRGPEHFELHWPFAPFNSYAADHKSNPGANHLRVSVQLTPANPRATFVIGIEK